MLITETKTDQGLPAYHFENRGVSYYIVHESIDMFYIHSTRNSIGRNGGTIRFMTRKEMISGPKVMQHFLDTVEAKPVMNRSSLDQFI